MCQDHASCHLPPGGYAFAYRSHVMRSVGVLAHKTPPDAKAGQIGPFPADGLYRRESWRGIWVWHKATEPTGVQHDRHGADGTPFKRTFRLDFAVQLIWNLHCCFHGRKDSRTAGQPQCRIAVFMHIAAAPKFHRLPRRHPLISSVDAEARRARASRRERRPSGPGRARRPHVLPVAEELRAHRRDERLPLPKREHARMVPREAPTVDREVNLRRPAGEDGV